MPNYLRDQQLKNLTINADKIKQISSLFFNRTNSFNSSIPKNSEPQKHAFTYFTIRFDGKGYRVFNIEELLSYYQQANDVERIIFTMENGESLSSDRRIGVVVELILDRINLNACSLIVASDDKDLADATFSAIQDVLIKCKTKNSWVRSAWTELIIQVLGISFGFLLSIWISQKVSSKLTIQNSFIILFFFILLIFSHTWSYLHHLIHRLLNHYFPNIDFQRHDKNRVNWLIQAAITAVIGAFVLWVLGSLSLYLLTFLSDIVSKN